MGTVRGRKRKDISPELVKEFEPTYQGNLGVRLLKKRSTERKS
jgi:hypothetical protein